MDHREVQLRSEMTCLSVAIPPRLVAVGGRSTLSLLKIDSMDNGPVLRFEQELSDKSTSDVAINPVMDNLLARGASRRNIEIWELPSLTCRTLLSLDRASVVRINWQPTDPNTLLVGASDGLLRMLDIRLHEPVHTIMAPRSREVRDCQFDPHDGCYLAACFDNGTVQTFDSRQPKQFARKMIVHDGPALCLAYHPIRRGILASGGSASSFSSGVQASYKLKLVAPDKDLFTIKSFRCSGVSCVTWGGQDYKDLYAGLDSNFDHRVLVWNVDEPFTPPQARLNGHLDTVTRVTCIGSAALDAAVNASSTSPSRESSRHGGEENDFGQNRRQVDSDLVVSVGKDGKCVIQEMRKEFTFFRRGRAFALGLGEIVCCDDNVMRDVSSISRTRGSAKAKTISLEAISPLREYRLDGIKSLKAGCEVNERINEAQSKNSTIAVDSFSLGFWKTVRILLDDQAIVEEQTGSDPTDGASNLEPVNDYAPKFKGDMEIALPPPPRPSLRSASSSPNVLGIAKQSSSSTTNVFMMPRKVSAQFDSLHLAASSSAVSNTSIRKDPASLLKEIASVETSLGSMFYAKSKVTSFRQLAMSMINSITADFSPSSSRDALLGRNKDETKEEEERFTATLIPSATSAHDFELTDKLTCLGEALDQLVNEKHDPQTALTVVLLLHQVGYPTPASLAKIKRWAWAVQSMFELKGKSSLALDIARRATDLVNQQTLMKREQGIFSITSRGLFPAEIDSRIGMACGNCHEPLPKFADKTPGACPSCLEVVARCSICRLIVSGMYATCLRCGHGGHVMHLREWFGQEGQTQCPLGCGCTCVPHITSVS